jgi:YesN/AraC family two-component response regulator
MIKVLLADDQELIRQSLSFVMSRQEDIEMVGTAANGCEALELVEEKQPDVVLLDIRMPEMDGVYPPYQAGVSGHQGHHPDHL